MPDADNAEADAAGLRLELYRSLAAMPAFGPFLARLVERLDATQADVAFVTRHAAGPSVPHAGNDGDRVETAGFTHPAGMAPPATGDTAVLAITVHPQPESEMTLSVRRPGSAPFSAAERHLLDSLAPDLATTGLVMLRYSAAERERRVYRKALDRLGIGVLLVDASCRLMATNGIGEELLRPGGVLTIAQGRLRLRTLPATARLEQAVAAAIALQEDPQGQRGEPVPIARPGGDDPSGPGSGPLTAFVFPGPQPFGFARPLVRTAVVVVAEPGRKSGIRPEDLMALFGLTRAEATLAIRLADGDSVSEAAASLGISRNTARAQLNVAFQKTGVARQSELVRLILNCAATCVLVGRDERLPPASGGRLPLDRR